MIISVVLAIIIGGLSLWRSFSQKNEGDAATEKQTEGSVESTSPGIRMNARIQKENGVIVAVAARQPFNEVITATGKVEANADRIAHVSPRISGQIVSVVASLGDRVTTGQTLVVLKSLEMAEATNRSRLSKTKLALAEANMTRIRTLVEKKIVARKELLQAETDYKIAQTELQNDRERLSLYGASNSNVHGSSNNKTSLPVPSPISGTITEKHAIVGELSDPSKSLFTVVDLSSIWVVVDIYEKDLAKVKRGESAAVTVDAWPDLKLTGRVTYLADVLDPATRTLKVRVEVANPDRKLKPEMFARVELVPAASAAMTLAVPEDAIQEIDGKKMIFVADVSGELFRAETVVTGRSSGGMVEIISGISEGQRYAIKGSFILKSELKKDELEGGAE
ncbi:MAG: efflux RND transporter periplasmic adaptor subunit [Chlorobiaceae bacterium]|nr:efflux RND transporter periplasmic adaptor subunit [Chlorobiaceae bacterium]